MLLLTVIVALTASVAFANGDRRFKKEFYGVVAPNCLKKEDEGKLLTQMFNKSKKCEPSTLNEQWMDCRFTADKTIIHIAGAIGVSADARLQGMMGSGFYVEAVDPEHKMRVMISKSHGTLLRVDRRDNLDKARGCLYDEVMINIEGIAGIPNDFD